MGRFKVRVVSPVMEKFEQEVRKLRRNVSRETTHGARNLNPYRLGTVMKQLKMVQRFFNPYHKNYIGDEDLDWFVKDFELIDTGVRRLCFMLGVDCTKEMIEPLDAMRKRVGRSFG